MNAFDIRFARPGRSAGGGAQAAGLMRPVVWLAGLFMTGCAVIMGMLLALFTAVTVAVIAVVAGAFMLLVGLALRARRAMGGRRGRRSGDEAETVIEARKVDGTWVAYGWERSGR